MWKCVEQPRLKSLEIIEAPDLADSHLHNVENCKKETKDKGASGNCVNSSTLSVKGAGWHIVFQYKCAGELEIFQVLLLCVGFITYTRLDEILLVTPSLCYLGLSREVFNPFKTNN